MTLIPITTGLASVALHPYASLLAHILVNAGTGELADPSYASGGSIQSPDGTNRDGGHAGHGAVLVAEADESDGSCAKYRPSIAIVTNAEPDHLDHYGTADRYHRAFVDHIGHARDAVVMCADDEGCLEVLRAVDADVAGRVVVYTTQDPDTLGDLNGAVAVRIESERERERTGREQCDTDARPARRLRARGVHISRVEILRERADVAIARGRACPRAHFRLRIRLLSWHRHLHSYGRR